MKKFVWRLQKVLDIKQKTQQIKRGQLLTVTEKLAVTRTNLLAQKRMLQDMIDTVAGLSPARRLTSQELLLKSTKKNDEAIKIIQGEVQDLQLQQKNLTAEFLKIKKFTESLEKLREQAKHRFITKQEKLQQKETDEYTSTRYARKIMQGA